ncbi:hypothetical protein [Actinocrispum wychmicini]|uniref:DUF3558 domain-containing protein n=1 Tax=Actinocrispum wychmicini TaxID=1213861 RepID=A0A4R2JI84_9PSEU|nr:hypothetical protein [Actinocrispum wychmicini]TCO59611.1 hypothetical protein EV192_104454 [Actinocrispum wychmicini]
MRILIGLSALALALTVTGCGGKSAEEGVGACKLLTPSDLEATFDSPFRDGKPTHQDDTGADQCVWTSSGGTFSITVLSQDRLAGAFKSNGMKVADLFEQAKLAYPNAKAIDLGDKAFASVSEVQVLDRDTWYSLSFHGAGTVEKLTELATRVVRRH